MSSSFFSSSSCCCCCCCCCSSSSSSSSSNNNNNNNNNNNSSNNKIFLIFRLIFSFSCKLSPFSLFIFYETISVSLISFVVFLSFFLSLFHEFNNFFFLSFFLWFVNLLFCIKTSITLVLSLLLFYALLSLFFLWTYSQHNNPFS